MRVGLTTIFNGSSFGSGLTQTAFFLAKAFKEAGHTVEFILPADSDDWFTDCKNLGGTIPVVKMAPGSNITKFDLVVEVVWYLPADIRRQLASKIAMFYHYPPIFYDIENSVYPISTLVRSFENIDCVWTWDHYHKDDLNYLKLLTRVPVYTCPLLWDSVFVDTFVKEEGIDEYKFDGSPSIVICESNESNTSHCTVPLTILSEIYKTNPQINWCVLNSEKISKREYFKQNILSNLHIPAADISGNCLRRIRLPDLRRESNVILSHQRFRPIKYMLLDALWLGIPLIHNCEMIRSIPGGEYFYDLNRIAQALQQWDRVKVLKSNPDLHKTRNELISRFGMAKFQTRIASLIQETFIATPILPPTRKAIRIAFYDMWVDFNPAHNLIIHMLKHNGYDVENDQTSPNLIVFGPFGTQNTLAGYSNVPKIFFTGENQSPLNRADIVLNVGFKRDKSENYLRLPIWMLEMNWYNEDRSKYQNPDPFALEDVEPKIEQRSKFCCFVASNGNCVERNTLYHIINRYKPVDSAGRLFNNTDRIDGEAGGSKGQHKKVEFYKQYNFVLTAENGSSPGYVTEKMLHAKLAGCVPIYWGDPEIAKEFNPGGFINVNDYKSVEQLLDRIKEVDTRPDLWRSIASVPLFDKEKIAIFKQQLTDAAKQVAACVSGSKIQEYQTFTGLKKPTEPTSLSDSVINEVSTQIKRVASITTSNTLIQLNFDKFGSYKAPKLKCEAKNVLVTTCYGDCTVDLVERLVKSSDVPTLVFTRDIDLKTSERLEKCGDACIIPLDTNWNPDWKDFWSSQHNASASLLAILANAILPRDTNVLYVDPRYQITADIKTVWDTIAAKEIFAIKQNDMPLGKWSHPLFCQALSVKEEEAKAEMFTADIFGFKTESKYKNLLVNFFSACCHKFLIEGEQFKSYSATCIGHKQEHSVFSVIALRAGLSGDYYNSIVDRISFEDAKARGALFYYSNGVPKDVRRILDNIDCSYVVNLAHREDRLTKFWTENPFLKGLTVREEAVYGNKLTLTKEIADLFRDNDFKWKKGVMGCALSHYNIWKRLRNNPNINNCLVLEDDTVLDKKFPLRWQEMADSMPADADMIFIGGVLPPNKPALPHVAESVNKYFAKVKKHTLFGGPARRYFHFCTYSYIITKSGVEKMCHMIEQRGIFTSIDHMMVNHGDEILNIYFTTPLLAKCFQDSDPAYVNANFNDFNRVDKFDSEIWNNVECFSKEEVDDIRNGRVTKRDDVLRIVYFEKHQPEQALEVEWLEELFKRKLEWVDSTASIPDGAPVIIFYQHTTPTNIIEGWVNRHMNNRCILYHASDESCKADISIYNHPGIKHVIRNYWRPDAVGDKVLHLPLGYAKGKRGSGELRPISGRPTVWSFAGAKDRNNREVVLQNLTKSTPNNALYLTPSFGTDKNLTSESYVAMLKSSQFVPCLDGFFNPESYRFYEALEAGALPLVPLDKQETYKNILAGSVNPPLLGISDWMTAGQVMNKLSARADVLDKVQIDMQNWWSGYKKYLSVRLNALL